MGESCCGPRPSAAPDRNHGDHGHDDHDHDHDHDHEGHTHDNHHHGGGGDCCSDSASVSSSSTCCGDQERCDEKCVEAVAALECVKACEEDPGHDASSGHPHQHGASGHDSDTACSTHLQAAFDKYSSYLEQLRCICRSAVDNGATSFQTCCNKPKPKKNQHRGKPKKDIDIPTYKPSGTAVKEVDVEKDGNTEPVSFLVSGMDCTSCADKLMRIFNTMAGVSQARVNFVVGSGEFTVNTSITSADEVIAFASSVSGFNLSKMIGGNYFLDILAPPAEAKKMAAESLPGVLDVQSLDKSTVRLAYDPAIIGARDLFAQVENRCRGLAQQQNDPQLVNSRRRLWDQLIKAALAALFTIPVAVVAWSENLVSERAEAIIGLTLGTVVQCIAIPEFYRPALSALWYSRAVEMDMLVVMSITAAYVYSVIAFGFGMAGKPLDEGQFFETSTMLITLILLGRLIAAFARVQAVTAVSLRSKQQNVAVLVEKSGDREIDARLLHYGDRFRVLPHTRVPTDGVVLSGTTEVDESMLTGEPLPVPKKVNDSIIAGTMNGDGSVVVQLTRLPGKNTVTDIAQLVEDAANSKPKLQDLADKVAGWFVPTMAIVALLVFVIWIGCGLGILRYSSGKAVGNAVAYAVATLAVACPCALGLAVPMVLVVAGGIAAKGGVIIKSAETTERARKVTDVVFDKTGTITEGDLAVVEEVVLSGDHSFNASLARALVAGGKHPVSTAVDKYLDGQAAEAMAGVCNVRVVPGAGIEAEYKGNRLRAGNTRWTSASDVAEVARLQDAGLTVLVITYNSVPVIAFGLSVQIRPEAQRVIAELKARNITLHLVSGDQKRAVQDVAASVGIPRENAVGEYTPPEKRDYVAALMADEGRYVMFCGDGTNDAVAVAQANLGAQIGDSLTSSDVTQGAADVVLLNGLEGIPFLLNVSQASFHRMYFNFVWSAIYNVLAVTMASGAWVKFRIPPRYAGLGEMVSVVPVILAAVSMFLLNLKHRVSK